MDSIETTVNMSSMRNQITQKESDFKAKIMITDTCLLNHKYFQEFRKRGKNQTWKNSYFLFLKTRFYL